MLESQFKLLTLVKYTNQTCQSKVFKRCITKAYPGIGYRRCKSPCFTSLIQKGFRFQNKGVNSTSNRTLLKWKIQIIKSKIVLPHFDRYNHNHSLIDSLKRVQTFNLFRYQTNLFKLFHNLQQNNSVR